MVYQLHSGALASGAKNVTVAPFKVERENSNKKLTCSLRRVASALASYLTKTSDLKGRFQVLSFILHSQTFVRKLIYKGTKY